MRTIITYVVLALILPVSAFSQFHIGFSGGLVQSHVKVQNDATTGTGVPVQDLSYLPQTGFQFSLPVAYKFNPYLSVQSELAYQRFSYLRKQGLSIPEQYIGRMEEDVRVRLNYVYTNLLAKISTGGQKFSMHLLVGPSLGFAGSGNMEISESITYLDNSQVQNWRAKSFSKSESIYNNREYGLVYGAGIELGLPYYKVFVEGRRYQSFSTFNPSENLIISSTNLQVGVLFPIR